MINVLGLCDYPEILQIFRLIRIIIGIIRIAVPILMIFTITMDFAGATAKGDEVAVKDAFKKAIVKGIAAILIFFLPIFVNVVLKISSSDLEYEVCLGNATSENIEREYTNRARKLVEEAKEQMTKESYSLAQNAVNKLTNTSAKQELQQELNAIKPVIEAKELVDKVRVSKKESDYEKAVDAVSKLPDSEYKTKLEEELEEIAMTMIIYVQQYSTDGIYIENPLGLPRYEQCDTRWKDTKYDIGGGPNGTKASFCSSSCGYTSFSMIAAGFNRDMTITPVTVVEKMRGIDISEGEITHYGYGAASIEDLTKESTMKYYNLKAKRVYASSGESQSQAIMRELSEGKALIILVPGHYMTLAGTVDGDVILLDPFAKYPPSGRINGKVKLSSIYNIYGGINQVISYEKIN